MEKKSGSYRKQAFNAYPHICVYCCFGVPGVLEVAHLDQNHKNNSVDNLALLCPTCHRMHDVGLIQTEVIRTMRDEKREINWKLLMKDAGEKAARTRKLNVAKKKEKLSAAAKKAWQSRKLPKTAKPAA